MLGLMCSEDKYKGRIASSIGRVSKAGLRVTEARKRLIRILAESERPLSVEDLSAQSEGHFDLVTVYRNLEVFKDSGIVERIQLESGKVLFELSAEEGHSHHIVCRSCHMTERIEFCMGGELERYATSRGFSNLSHTIEVFGICPECETGQ